MVIVLLNLARMCFLDQGQYDSRVFRTLIGLPKTSLDLYVHTSYTRIAKTLWVNGKPNRRLTYFKLPYIMHVLLDKHILTRNGFWKNEKFSNCFETFFSIAKPAVELFTLQYPLNAQLKKSNSSFPLIRITKVRLDIFNI